MTVTNLAAILFCASLSLLSMNVAAQQRETAKVKTPLGIVKDKPDKGRFVATPMGYMVPYEAKMPGGDYLFEMIPVPGGTFKFGSSPDERGHNKSESPQLTVEIAPFWIGKTEVTWAQYTDFMKLHDYFKAFEIEKIRKVDEADEFDVITVPSLIYDASLHFDGGGTSRHPATSMTQYSAKQYTKWLSKTSQQFYRLPSAVEWEYACRAGASTAYSFGDNPKQLPEYGWFAENSDGNRHPVATKKPNAWGLYDMHGNAAEWVLDADAFDGNRWLKKFRPRTNTAIYWPDTVLGCIARGGSCESTAEQCRSASRASSTEEWSELDPNWPISPSWMAGSTGFTIGFRFVRPLQPPKTKADQERYWKAGVDELTSDIEDSIDNEGRGARGIVGKDLQKAIKDLKERRKK